MSVSYLINFYDKIYTGLTTFGTFGVRDSAHTRACTRIRGRVRGRVCVSRFLTHIKTYTIHCCAIEYGTDCYSKITYCYTVYVL